MSKKTSHSGKGKSLFGGGRTNVNFENEQIFIGIVDNVISKNSENLKSYGDSEFLDNRNAIYIFPIGEDKLNLKKCYLMNSHNVDLPIVGEPVLVCKTSVGNVIIDRFSPHAFGVNYELGDYLLNNNLVGGKVSIDIDDETKKEFGIEKTRPFFSKVGSKSFFGRNNQYIIFQYGERIDADSQEVEYNSDGSFIKIGVKDSDKGVDAKSDRSKIIIGVDSKVQTMIEAQIESNFNMSVEEEPNNGVGVESDELVFVGRDFVVLYTEKDLLLKGRRLVSEFDEIINRANKIKNGSESANEPTVLGNEFINMMGDLISILEGMKHQTTQGLTVGLAPNSLASIKRFRSKYLKKNNSPIHSTKIYNE